MDFEPILNLPEPKNYGKTIEEIDTNLKLLVESFKELVEVVKQQNELIKELTNDVNILKRPINN